MTPKPSTNKNVENFKMNSEVITEIRELINRIRRVVRLDTGVTNTQLNDWMDQFENLASKCEQFITNKEQS